MWQHQASLPAPFPSLLSLHSFPFTPFPLTFLSLFTHFKMIALVGYIINSAAFETITKDIILQNKEKHGYHDDIDIDAAAYDFITDEEFNDYKDTYFPGISSLKNLVITRYNYDCDSGDSNIFVGYVVKGANKNIAQKQKELEAFKDMCPPHLIVSEEADTYIFESL